MTPTFPPPARPGAPARAVRYCITLSGLPLAELHRAAAEAGRPAEELLHDIVLRWLLRASRRRARQQRRAP